MAGNSEQYIEDIEFNGQKITVDFELVGEARLTHYSKGTYWDPEEIDYDTEVVEVTINEVWDENGDDINLTREQESELEDYLIGLFGDRVDDFDYDFYDD